MKKLILILLLVSMSACTANLGTFTLISKNVVSLDNFDISKADKIRNVKGTSVGQIIFVFPIGELNPNVESAMTDAFKKVDGDLFTDAQVTQGGFYIPYIYGRFWVNIEGDVVKTRN